MLVKKKKIAPGLLLFEFFACQKIFALPSSQLDFFLLEEMNYVRYCENKNFALNANNQAFELVLNAI